MRIVFMGTPDFSVPSLQKLHAAGHVIIAVYTQPPRPAGRRGLELTYTPVHQAAQNLHIPVHTPLSLRGEEQQQQFDALNADVAVVIAYGMLLPEAILQAPHLGCYNAHASLLPRWRGAAPIQRAIMAGDQQTGVMVMKMDVGLDTGPVALTHKIDIDQDMTAGQLHDALSQISADLLVEAMAKLEKDNLPLTPQPSDGVTYASKISKQETRIDWNRPAWEVHKHICGLSPFPGSWCEMQIGDRVERVKLLQSDYVPDVKGQPSHFSDKDGLVVYCAQGAVRLKILQKAGSRALDAQTFLRGAKITAIR